MKKSLKSIRNYILLFAGLGIIGFSAFRVVKDFEHTSEDRIGGEEIVIIAENTPIPAESFALTDNKTATETSLAPQELDLEEHQPTKTSFSIESEKISESQSEKVTFQDTFLTQIKENPRERSSAEVIPDRIVIPIIQLNARVIPAGSQTVKVGDKSFDQWVAPNQFAAGWHGNSSYLGESGNTVINGHHNEYGEVFGNLIDLLPGETIFVYSGDEVFSYIISNKIIVKEKNEDMDKRMENSAWIQPSLDERLTLITCWPPESNTHRLIIVAVPFISSPERVIG